MFNFYKILYIECIITQPLIYGLIVYFLLCHESVNYWPGNSFGYWLGLYHGLVSRFSANNRKALIDLHDEDTCTVHLRQETLCSNGGYEALFGTLQHP